MKPLKATEVAGWVASFVSKSSEAFTAPVIPVGLKENWITPLLEGIMLPGKERTKNEEEFGPLNDRLDRVRF